jgi:hypothetical protein
VNVFEKLKNYSFFGLIFSSLVLGGCDLFGLFKDSRVQKVSDAVQISREWTEIKPSEPLKSVSRIHKISVRTGAVETFDESDKTAQTIKFKNGESGRVEAVLFDDEGNEYKLGLAGIGGAGGGFYFGRKLPPRNLDEPPDKESDFPFEKTYTKLKIRSSVPFQSEKIEWIAETQK